MGAVKPKDARAFVDAAYSGDAKTVRAMLDGGVPADTRDRGTTALQVAASQGHTQVVQALLRAGADPNAKNGDGLSLLVQAVRSESLPVVRALLGAGADVNRVETHENSRETPLMTGAMQGNLTLVKLLVKAGATVHARSSNGDSALDLARRCRRQKVVEFLEAVQLTAQPDPGGKRSLK